MPGERFELSTNDLQDRCSTPELTRHAGGRPEHSLRELNQIIKLRSLALSLV